MPRPQVWSPSQWVEIFDSVMDYELDCDDQWILCFNYNLREKLTQKEMKKGWKIHSSHTHADYMCGSCHRTWHSARSTLLFHYRLRGQRGTVIMRPLGQACRSCIKEGFERPGFLDREVEDSLVRLSSKILKNCYRVDNDVHVDEAREIKKTKPHEASLCEACIMGMPCGEVRDSETD